MDGQCDFSMPPKVPFKQQHKLIAKLSVRLALWKQFKPSSKSNFTDHSKVVLLLWILFVIYVSCLCLFSCLFIAPCGQLLRKCWSLGSLVCDVLLCLSHFSCPGSGVVLDCIDSWYLPSFCSALYWTSRTGHNCEIVCRKSNKVGRRTLYLVFYQPWQD